MILVLTLKTELFAYNLGAILWKCDHCWVGFRHYAVLCYLVGCTQAEPQPAQSPMAVKSLYSMYAGAKLPLRDKLHLFLL